MQKRNGLRVQLRVQQRVELQALQRGQQPIELRLGLLGWERVRLLVQLRVRLWVERPPGAFSATYAPSRASRVVNRPSPGPWSLDLLSDATTSASGG